MCQYFKCKSKSHPIPSSLTRYAPVRNWENGVPGNSSKMSLTTIC